MITVKNIFSQYKKFRVSSCYCLTEWHFLSVHEQQLLHGLYDEEEVYGIFQPVSNNSAFTSKVAYKDVALLYMHVQQAGYLPAFVLHDENKLHEVISQLVFDSILEIEWQGNYVSGTAAVQAIYGDVLPDVSVIPDRLSTLSANAIQYAMLLKHLNIRLMAQRLYTYNTIPMDAATRSTLNAANDTYWFLYSDETTNEILRSHWTNLKPSSTFRWMAWTRPLQYHNGHDETGLTFKLYISPQIKELAANFKTIVQTLNASTAYCFKTGNTVKDLLRPDKMVAYFKNKADLLKTAAILSKELEGCAVHGVPFTKQLDKTGLLSFGVDPLKKDILKLVDGGSWRTTVTGKLAAAIIQAQHNRLDTSAAMQFIRAKLSAFKINVADWTPVDHSI
jgi:hypothetical protein